MWWLDAGIGRWDGRTLTNDLSGGPPMVVFDYQTSRSGSHARAFLQGWQGTLMADGYGGYKALFGQGVTELGCWAHARRKFFDLHAASNKPHEMAEVALQRIGELYAIEAQAREQSPAERQMLRQTQALPRLQALHAWLIQQRQQTTKT
ncbi:IS66 family transposase, partial [Parachitinimonas caeni]